MIKNKCENEMTCNYKQQKNNNRNTSPCVLTASPRGTQDNNILWDPKKLQAAKKKDQNPGFVAKRVNQQHDEATRAAKGSRRYHESCWYYKRTAT